MLYVKEKGTDDKVSKEITAVVQNDAVSVEQAVLDGTLALETGETLVKEKSKQRLAYRILKRGFDFILSLIASIILLIPILVIALIIFVKDPGNPFYIQKRVGLKNKEIHILKFRSMRKGADEFEDSLTPEQLEEYRLEYKLEDDPRLIGYKKPGDSKKCFGGILRRLSIDELPQVIWNICIKGDMSIVGPRPILREELENHYMPDEQKILISVKPGLTGYWQAYARNDVGYSDHERQDMELYYCTNRSLLLDIKIIFKTIGTVIVGKGAI